MATRTSKDYNQLRESLVNVNVNAEKQKEVVIKKEESFIKGYQTMQTFFESKEYEHICDSNKHLMK